MEDGDTDRDQGFLGDNELNQQLSVCFLQHFLIGD